MWACAPSLGLVTALLLGLTGTARAESAVSAQATANATSIELDGCGTSATHIVKVASVTLTCDAVGGCTLRMSSAGLNKPGGGTPVAVQLALVARDTTAPTTDEFTTVAGDSYQISTGSTGTLEVDLYIKYRPAPLQDPGTYVASIALAVVDN